MPWLDRATNAVLGFVARRLVRSRISFLAASREGSDSFYESSDLSEPRLKPLDDASSAELLALAHPDVSPGTAPHRGRGTRQPVGAGGAADGALRRAARDPDGGAHALSECLQVMFASHVADLPDRSRELLLIADLDGTGDLAPPRRPRLAELPSTTSFPPSGTTW